MRQSIVETLRRHPRFDLDFTDQMTDDVLRADKATQDRWIFQHAATWPDLARNLPADERAMYDQPRWHYVNFPLFVDDSDRMVLHGRLSANVSSEYPTKLDPKEYNVLQAIAHCREAIASKAMRDVKAVAYCWLLHLVGDVHQPLHSTALYSVDQFPHGDRGGNEIPLMRGRNLHSLWDNLLGRQYFMRNVDHEVAELLDRERYGDVWHTALQETEVRMWAEESHTLYKSAVYSQSILGAIRDTPTGQDVVSITLPDTYMRQAGEVARHRIVAAGIRLAMLLRDEPAPFHIQAHRGAGIGRPENTLESFQWSWNLGVTPEADLRTTRDGVIVCYHDADLRRVVSNAGQSAKTARIEDLLLKEVQNLEVGSFRGRQFNGQRVPTLANVLTEMRGRPNRLLYLDIKTAELRQLVNLIREHGVERQVIFTTTHHHLIEDWKKRAPESLTLLWNGGSEPALVKKLASVRKTGFAGVTHLQIHVRIGDLTAEDPFMPRSAFLRSLGEELQSRGIVFQVLPWESSDPRVYEKLLALGVDSFATDYPEVTLKAVQSFRQKNAAP
jgi:glycerophosphoryl diester phosphodiesterase